MQKCIKNALFLVPLFSLFAKDMYTKENIENENREGVCMMNMSSQHIEEQATKLARDLLGSRRIVLFGGAGTSTESGIPDFRSAGGVFDREAAESTGKQYPYPPEVMVSSSYFEEDMEGFFTFYRDKLLYPEAKPNGCHRALARLEQEGKLLAVITQNIDGLHQAAGSQEVLELHGSVHRNICMSCHRTYELAVVLDSPTVIPHCPACGGILKPDVVLYGEVLDDDVITAAVRAVQQADLLIIAGTSLSVQPAASFVRMRRPDAKLILMNRTATSIDSQADTVYRELAGQLLEAAVHKMLQMKLDQE